MMNRAALVTGGGRGIGRAIALRLARDGAPVAVHYGSGADAAMSVVHEIENAGGKAVALQAELRQVDQIEPMFEKLDRWLISLGVERLGIMVNNAGVGSTHAIETLTSEEFDRVFEIDVRALLFVLQKALPRMARGGSVINISSVVGCGPYPAVIAYAAAKAAVNSITRSLAVACGAQGIRVNALAPGATQTDFTTAFADHPAARQLLIDKTALGRFGEPQDIADVAAFLASDDARWITGECIRASGGMGL